MLVSVFFFFSVCCNYALIVGPMVADYLVIIFEVKIVFTIKKFSVLAFKIRSQKITVNWGDKYHLG